MPARLVYYTRMTKDQFKQIDPNETMLIDIREADELETLPTVAGAVHMPMGKVFTELGKGGIPKDKKIVAVCRSGGRCKVLADFMHEHGYDNIDYLEGGLNGLQEE